MATASVTLALNQSSFLAGMARAQSSVSALGASVGRIGAAGFAIAGTAAIAFGTAAAYGIKKAFDLGGKLSDVGSISGRSVKEILLMTRALQDAGVSMERIDRFMLTGADRGKVIARALASITSGDWRDAALSVGKQADILDKNAATFDRVSDLLGRSGDKLQGFFVGAAGSIGKALLPILEKFDKIDLASQGEKFGRGLLIGAQALAGFFQKPELLFKSATDYFGAAILGVGNTLIAVFKTGITFFKDGMLQAMTGIGSALAATLLESFKRPLAQLQAGFEELADSGPNERILKFQIASKEKLRDVIGRDMSGGLNPIGQGLQKQIEDQQAQLSKVIPFEDRVKRIMDSGGPRLGFGEGQTADQFRKQAGEQTAAALTALADATGKFKVEDILGASNALKQAQADISEAARLGRNMLPAEMAAQGNKKRSGIVVAGTGGGIDESLFSANAAASNADFANRWSNPASTLGDKKTSKNDALLQKLSDQMEKQNQITEEAWK